MLSLYALLAIAVLIGGFAIFTRFTRRDESELALRILTLGYCILALLRMFLTDTFDDWVLSGEDIFESLRRWFHYISYAVLPVAVFCRAWLFRGVSLVFCMPTALISVFTMQHTLEQYLLRDDVDGVVLPAFIVCTAYIFELALAVSIPICIQLSERHRLYPESKRAWANMLLSIPCMLLCMMPAYLPQSLVGYTNLPDGAFELTHLVWILLVVLTIIGLYFFFRNKSSENKRLYLIFMTIAQVYHSCSAFLRGLRLTRLPLQLCSIAAFFFLYALITRSRKVLHFAVLANFVGAIIGVIAAPLSNGALSFWNIHYFYEHSFVLIFPVLGMLVGEIPRVDKASLKGTFKIFTVYFAIVFAIGFILNCFTDAIGIDYLINFFYIFDVNMALSFVPFVGFVSLIGIPIGSFTFYPLLVIVVYLVFIGIISGYYGLLRLIYRTKDGLLKKRMPA